MATSKIKGLDEPTLEGGGSGGGYRSARGANEKRLEQRINDMPAKERTSLDDIGKQFETLSPMAQRAQDKIAKVNAERKSSQPSDVDSQYSRHQRLKEKGFYDDSKTKDERLQIIKELGLKKGGTVSASSRADGCCVKGKTKGRMI